MRNALCLSLVFAAVAGCHDHGLPPPDDLGVGGDMSAGGDDLAAGGDLSMVADDIRMYVSWTMFAQQLAQAICNRRMACGQLDAAQMNACLERNLRHIGWDLDTEISKGRVMLNDAQCLAAIANSRCDLSDSALWAGKCQQFLFTPHVANGSACLSAQECTSGYCQHAGSDAGMPEQPNGCPGTCANPKATGAPCRVNSDCAADSTCDATNVCSKLGALNDNCTNQLGAGTGPACQFGLMCPTFAATPTCVTPSTQMTLHGACDPLQGAVAPYPACGGGMYCQVQYTATTTACTKDSDCGAANITGYCDTAGTMKCQQESGGKCEMKIASGTACDPKNEGIFSSIESQCADGTECAQLPGQTSYTCQAFGGANAVCNGDNDCKVGLGCVSGHCAPWLSDGQLCMNTSGLCAAPQDVNACIADNADAGTGPNSTTCQQEKGFGAKCIPGFEDSLCAPADTIGSAGCVASGSSGTCAPHCY